jgi:hypothetical protein
LLKANNPQELLLLPPVVAAHLQPAAERVVDAEVRPDPPHRMWPSCFVS